MKNDDKVSASVYVTNDYSKFKKLDRNRAVKDSRLQKLIASFSVKAILCPIIVNKRMEIIDGQGRYDACKALGLPIYYVIDANATIDDCMRMNHYNTPWTSADFARSYADGGNANYIRLLAICEEMKIPMRRALRLCNKTNGREGDLIQTGNLKFSTNDMNTVREVMEFANRLMSAFMIGSRCAETFYNGVSVMMNTDGFDQMKMLKNAEKERSQFTIMSRLEDMLKEFSRVYNRGVRKCDRLYFEDYMRDKGSNLRSYDTSYFGKEDPDVSTLKRRVK